jgi:hypothetical protein
VKPSAPQASPPATGASPPSVTPVIGLGSLGAMGTF